MPPGVPVSALNPQAPVGHLTFLLDRVAVLVWTRPPTMAGVEDCRHLFARVPPAVGNFAYLAVVEVDAGNSMPQPVRNALSTLLKQYEPRIAAAAIVFEGTGFTASIVRSVVSTINLASRIKYPTKVHTTLEAAAEWLVDSAKGCYRTDAASLVKRVNEKRRVAPPGSIAS